MNVGDTAVETFERRAAPGAESVATVRLGLIMPPTLGPEVAGGLGGDLRDALGARYPSVNWELTLINEHLVTPPVHLTELVDVVRERLLTEGWDLALAVTDLPLRLSRRPLLTHASPTHGIALVSLPALGLLQRRRRLLESLADGVGAILGDPAAARTGRARHLRTQRRLTELATDVDDRGQAGTFFLARVITGNIRLLIGMVAANHPWRLVVHLSRALIGALAAAVFAMVSLDVWRIAAGLDTVRLTVITLGSLAAAVVTLIAAHQLWERNPAPEAREQVLLFNLATTATVVIGIVTLYAAIFVLSLVGAFLLIEPALFRSTVGEGAGVGEYLRLAWLASSLATAGGALGATLETDAAVREAAYARRPER